ncbi:hypothetical protein A2U01_0024012, partial [Trifolium medium]|nr:hypothetical protein [Trifolium medium]
MEREAEHVGEQPRDRSEQDRWVATTSRSGFQREVTRRVTRFPLKWTKRHFDEPTDYYLTKDDMLSDEERAGLAKIQTFMNGFQPARLMTKKGVAVLDSQRRPKVEARYINTKSLLECRSQAECRLLLDNMADFGDELLKIIADQKGPKKGKKAGVQSGSPVVRQPPPKRQREEPIIDVD